MGSAASDLAGTPLMPDMAHDLTAEEYELFRRLIYEKSGINLGDQKQQLVRARLGKRLRKGNFKSYRAYYDYVAKDKSGKEMRAEVERIVLAMPERKEERRDQEPPELPGIFRREALEHTPEKDFLADWADQVAAQYHCSSHLRQ